MSTDPTPETPPPPKPHFLRRVQIRNYKSIAFCDVTLEPLTILVGRNATGKSNFLDALGFLRDVVVKSVADAVYLHGSRDAVVCRSSRDGVVAIDIECEYQNPHTEIIYQTKYGIELNLAADTRAGIASEHLQITEVAGGRMIGFDRHDNQVTSVGDPHQSLPLNGWSPPSDRPMLGMYAHMDALDFGGLLANIRLYNFNPAPMRLPQLPTPGTFLMPDGSNLASVYNSTMVADPAAAKRAARYLNAVARSVEFAGVLSAGGYEILEFDTSGNADFWNGPDRKADRFPAASMSDGTLRAFAAVMAAFQTVNPYGSPSLVAIEEPETALHPAAMRALVAALDEATWRTQILITTHSPDLLDAEEVKPANVRVVEMVDGHTVIGPVDGASVSNVRDDLATLGELERGRQLGLDRDDLVRQAELAGRELIRS